MSRTILNCGYVPLVDSAPLIIARELHFDTDEGIRLNLLKQPSWSALRDLLALGHLEVAHILSPLPIAMSLGLGGLPSKVDALMVMSVNGNVIGLSKQLSEAAGLSDVAGFKSPVAVRDALLKVSGDTLRFGVPFPYSMHSELVSYWLRDTGVSLDLRTVPPSLMAEAIEAKEIDAFCVGEPWGSVAVDFGAADIVLPGAAIWSFAPEKVLGARHRWVEDNPETTAALMRTIYRACVWLDAPGNRALASEILERSEHLGIAGDVLDRALAGRMLSRPKAFPIDVPGFLRFHTSAATFPWRSQAAWIANGIAARIGLDPASAMQTARSVFRADLYRLYLSKMGVDMPGASEKLEGALHHAEAVASTRGGMILGPDAFFDGAVFDLNGALTPNY